MRRAGPSLCVMLGRVKGLRMTWLQSLPTSATSETFRECMVISSSKRCVCHELAFVHQHKQHLP